MLDGSNKGEKKDEKNKILIEINKNVEIAKQIRLDFKLV